MTAINTSFGSSTFAYNGLGDRLSQNGVNYTLDLNVKTPEFFKSSGVLDSILFQIPFISPQFGPYRASVERGISNG